MGFDFVLSNMYNFLEVFRVMVMAAVADLGLLSQPEEAYYEEQHASSCVIVMDGQTPALIPVSVAVSWIKKRVPVVEYRSFLERFGMDDDDDDAVCRVCLDCIKGWHEIRVLSNCYHVFHQKCLDAWLDEDHVTCPLCRSILLPAQLETM